MLVLLVDLGGHTAGGATLMLLAHHPARIIKEAVGWFDTTGMPTVYYLLTDDVMDPPGREGTVGRRDLVGREGSCMLCRSPYMLRKTIGNICQAIDKNLECSLRQIEHGFIKTRRRAFEEIRRQKADAQAMPGHRSRLRLSPARLHFRKLIPIELSINKMLPGKRLSGDARQIMEREEIRRIMLALAPQKPVAPRRLIIRLRTPSRIAAQAARCAALLKETPGFLLFCFHAHALLSVKYAISGGQPMRYGNQLPLPLWT